MASSLALGIILNKRSRLGAVRKTIFCQIFDGPERTGEEQMDEERLTAAQCGLKVEERKVGSV